ncbi:MAG TPA: NAD(P)-binding domain-containing protein [Polyangiaceae bacterium]
MSAGEPREPRAALAWLARAEARFARSRQAHRVRPSSDVSRLRGVLVASGLAVVCVLASAAWRLGAAPGSPGPLSESHQRAALACPDCHQTSSVADAACAGCHGARASTRAGHERLQASGELRCGSCHAAHGPAQLLFHPGGGVELVERGRRVRAEAHGSFRPAQPMTIPVLSAAPCAGCHELDRATDPIARCLPASRASASALPILCFGEHRSVAQVASVTRPGVASASGDAARTAAAEVITQRGWMLSGNPRYSAWLWVSTGLLLGLVALRVRARITTQKPLTPIATEPALPQRAPERRYLPQVDVSTCLGCHACVDACPYDVLEVQRYVAVVVRSDACCGLTACADQCPNGSLVVRQGEPVVHGPRTTAALESVDVEGLFLAGDLSGVPLIRNAIQQGAHAVRQIATRHGKPAASSDPVLDLVIVGAGPAGLSAALEAKARGLSAVVLEQASIAESIRSFPRGKLVLDRGAAEQTSERLWLKECTKEELYRKWLGIVRREGLVINEQTRVTGVERFSLPDGGRRFRVLAEDARAETRVLHGRHVLLAVGRRGTPRKLEVALRPEVQSRVHYSLSDARSFAGQRVVVVGLGDTALETALALSRQPRTQVTILHRGADFTRGNARNVEQVKRMCGAGALSILWQTRIEDVGLEALALTGPSGGTTLGYDALFVMIGGVPPRDLLRACSIRWPEPAR